MCFGPVVADAGVHDQRNIEFDRWLCCALHDVARHLEIVVFDSALRRPQRSIRHVPASSILAWQVFDRTQACAPWRGE